MKYFDQDESGSVSRQELLDGFNRMKIPLNERQIKNIFTILDKNNDNHITMEEFTSVFAKHLDPNYQPPKAEQPEIEASAVPKE